MRSEDWGLVPVGEGARGRDVADGLIGEADRAGTPLLPFRKMEHLGGDLPVDRAVKDPLAAATRQRSVSLAAARADTSLRPLRLNADERGGGRARGSRRSFAAAARSGPPERAVPRIGNSAPGFSVAGADPVRPRARAAMGQGAHRLRAAPGRVPGWSCLRDGVGGAQPWADSPRELLSRPGRAEARSRALYS